MSEPAGLAAEMAALISALQTDALALVATAPMEALRLVYAGERNAAFQRCPLPRRKGARMSPDTIIILRSRGRRLAKLIRADGTTQNYDDAETFDLFAQPLRDIWTRSRPCLPDCSAEFDCMVVRGAIVDPARTSGVRRIVHPDHETGELPTLCEFPRRWLALDVDGLPIPAGIDARDLPACAAAARAALPPAFHAARAVVTASASHGIKPGLRLRYWCWCDRAVSGPELRRWLRGAPVDKSVFLPAQPIYTAAPVFAGWRR